MYTLLLTSFRVILGKFPNRAFVRNVQLYQVVGVYALSFAASTLMTFVVQPRDEARTISAAMLDLALEVGLTLVVIVLMRWIINKYAKEKFSLLETLSLDASLTPGANITATIVGAAVYMTIGETVEILMGFTFVICMLFVYQSAISQIAAITKNQAALVLLGPFIIIFGSALVISLLFATTAANVLLG